MVLLFAWRYFKGKKSTQAVQIISWVSILAMTVGTAALIIVLSVFNGFESFIKNLYSDFYPQIKITAIEGKTFIPNDSLLVRLKNLQGIQSISTSLEDNVLFSYEENQVIATLKGIDTAYNHVTNMNKNVRYGKMDFTSVEEIAPIVLGIGISNRLGASDESPLPINCYSFKKGTSTSFLDMAQAYNSSYFSVTGVYYLQEEIDNKYAFAPLHIVQELTQNVDKISSIEISLSKDAKQASLEKEVKQLSAQYHLKTETRYEQNKTLYFILKSERWAVYAILTLMLIIASFNIIGSLSMLVIEKQKDISILKAMGMQHGHIRNIFMATGILLSTIGAGIGCVLATSVCILQQQFGFIKLGGSGSFLIDAYPVKMKWEDFLLVMLTVIVIAAIASIIPSIKAASKPIELRVK
jgi:lipoprotein-releasing system permease protein